MHLTPFYGILFQKRKIMNEKIKIYVTARIAEILEKDAEGFEFFKADGRTVNKNALLTKIILNYHKEFDERQRELLDYLRSKIGSTVSVSTPKLEALCTELAGRLGERSAADGGKFDRLISLKPTRETESLIAYIDRYMLGGRSLSEYFRNLFSSYADMPQDKRERVVFKPQYEAITKSIEEGKRVFITMKSKRVIETAAYAVANSKEEMHCYVLTSTAKSCSPIRLSRILSVTPIAKRAQFSDDQLKTFSKMLTYGPQFSYTMDEEPVIVQLSDNGMTMFKQFYVHRPIPEKIEGNMMTFYCSHTQILQYFRRFGRQAKILSPTPVAERMYHFHRSAANAYKSDN